MKLSSQAIIAREKIANYLLAWRPENDKSQFLARAGYTDQDADRLADDIRNQLLSKDAEFECSTDYGDVYRITSALIGPNGRALNVTSIWMIEAVTSTTKFITLYPAKEN
jgi:hypothetical protein